MMRLRQNPCPSCGDLPQWASRYARLAIVQRRLLAFLLFAVILLATATRPMVASAQPFPVGPGGGFDSSEHFELDAGVRVDRAAGAIPSLERVKAYLADRQWNEAIAALRTLLEQADTGLMNVTDRRYVGLRDYIHLQLANLPDEALLLYRSRVDPMAGQLYRAGMESRDRSLLLEVVARAFASHFGDDALLALGDMALESGDYNAARWYWERMLPTEPLPTALLSTVPLPTTPLPTEPLPTAPPTHDAASTVASTWPGYPDTDIDLASIRARLVLVSILEGAPERARDELAQFTRLHGNARGRLGGQEVNYAATLGALLATSTTWPPPTPNTDWPTFAGNQRRNQIAPTSLDPAGVAWRIALPTVVPHASSLAASSLAPSSLAPSSSVPDLTLGYYPIHVGHLVLLNTQHEILAVALTTGRAAWRPNDPIIYRARLEAAIESPAAPNGTLGVPRHTMTVFEGRLYAKMGTTITTGPPAAMRPGRPGNLICLDLRAEGRLCWGPITPEEGWAFEGTPVADASHVYVAMRRSDVRPQAHVACFDARTGRRLWRRFVCSAEIPGGNRFYQRTHNLLTLRGETLYYNTNLGAVAAMATDDGRLLWLTRYPRARRGNLANRPPHWQRDLNPCVCNGATLLVAPTDSPRIFAFDAATGQILWQTGTQVDGVTHLLGTTDDHLIATGDRVYWIGLHGDSAGHLQHVWPGGNERLGCGRGVLAGTKVYWPTRQHIYVFDQKTARAEKVIDLIPRGLTGGNLLVAGQYLLIATDSELIALKPTSGPPPMSHPQGDEP